MIDIVRQQSGLVSNPLDPARLQAAKRSFTTRRVNIADIACLLSGSARVPRAGDLVLARVDEIGFVDRLQQIDGRRARLFEGDEIIVCYGDRYAPHQVEALVPESLEPCNLAAAGGIAADVTAWHEDIMIWQTRLTPLGLLGDVNGRVLKLADYALAAVPTTTLPPLIAVAGTSMNAGKTRTASGLALGLARAGHRVAAIKITGTGSGGDLWAMHDAGAVSVLDFTDAGFASSHRLKPAELEKIFDVLVTQAAASGATVIVAEIADGLYQADSAAVLCQPAVKAAVTGMLFAASDSMGAGAGIQWLRNEGYPVLAVSGKLCLAPLLIREVQTTFGLPVLKPEELECAEIAASLLSPKIKAVAG